MNPYFLRSESSGLFLLEKFSHSQKTFLKFLFENPDTCPKAFV